MSGSQERRTLPLQELRVEQRQDEGPRLTGLAAVFNQWVNIGPFFRERIAPGAFTGTLREDEQRSLFNHDPNVVLGRTANGTLTLREDEAGLRYEVSLPDTQQARDVAALVERGDVDGMSIMFRVLREEWDFDADPEERTILAVELLEAGPVTFPAYQQTSVDLQRAEALLVEARSQHAAVEPAEPEVDPDAKRMQDEVDILRTRGG